MNRVFRVAAVHRGPQSGRSQVDHNSCAGRCEQQFDRLSIREDRRGLETFRRFGRTGCGLPRGVSRSLCGVALESVPDEEDRNANDGDHDSGRPEQPKDVLPRPSRRSFRRTCGEIFGDESGMRGPRRLRAGWRRSRLLAGLLQGKRLAAMRAKISLPRLPVPNRERFAAARTREREVGHVERRHARRMQNVIYR